MQIGYQQRNEKAFTSEMAESPASAMDDAISILETEISVLGETIERLGGALGPVSRVANVDGPKENPAAPISSSRMRMQILQFASRVKDRRAELSRMLDCIEI